MVDTPKKDEDDKEPPKHRRRRRHGKGTGNGDASHDTTDNGATPDGAEDQNASDKPMTVE